MGTFSKEIPDDRLKRSQMDEIVLDFIVTGAKTAAQFALQNAPCLVLFDTGDQTQAKVDTLLGTSSDVTYATSFGSTAMGTDSFGFIIAHGSAKKLVSCEVTSRQTTGGSPANSYALFQGAGAATTALTDALTNQCAVTPAGNIYGHCVIGNVDSLSAGAIRVRIKFEAA